jgi:RNA polymerase sigma factor (sigma-70 family)
MAAPELNVRAAAAVDDLYRRHVGDVYRYTYAVLGNHADAEDVTQTTFVNALRALERGEQPRDPSNWLLAIAHNIVRQRWRQAAARPTEVELDHEVADASPEPDVELDELVRALQRIPPAQREALVMRELEGRSYREISELLGLSTAALETLLFRARRSLAEELENLVTCQSAELAISKRIDGRLSRKERRRLDSHLAECAPCARLAETAGRQRRAFKGLAVLPIPVGLALFKGAPAASAAAALPTIGGGAAGSGIGTTGVGAGGATAGAGGATAGAGGAAGTGGMTAGGSLLGGAVAKVAAVVVAGTVATGIGYEGVKAVTQHEPQAPARISGQTAGHGPANSTRHVPATPVAKTAVARVVPTGTGSATTGAQPLGTSASTGTYGSAQAGTDEPGETDAARRGVPVAEVSDEAPKAPKHSPAPRPTPQAPTKSTPSNTPSPTPSAPGTPQPGTPQPGTPPASSPGTPNGPPSETPVGLPAGAGSSAGGSGVSDSTPCPGAGTGPGNGSGCGLANGHEKDGQGAPSTAQTQSTETPPAAASAESADASTGAGAGADAGKSDGKSNK